MMTADALIASMLIYLSPIIGDAEIDKEQVRCMADNAYFESALESRIGKRQVVYAVMDRVASKHYPDTPCKVIWQKDRDKRSGKVVSQFSWTWDGRPDLIKFTNKKGQIQPNTYRNYAMAIEESMQQNCRLFVDRCEVQCNVDTVHAMTATNEIFKECERYG